jgi:HD-GYP domain-containing protein (c-di-GMP phosphodiesterase class II)
MRGLVVEAAGHGDLENGRAVELLERLRSELAELGVDGGAHTTRVGEYAALFSRAAGFEAEEANSLRAAASVHDVGKVAISTSIWLKPGALTDAERELARSHTTAGFELLAGSGSKLVDLAATIALTHHERVDGAGYPKGLAHDEIPAAGRIVAIADVFDSLIDDRPYRRRLRLEDAVHLMLEERDKAFDAALLDQFLGQLDRVLAIAKESLNIDQMLTR